MLAVIVALLLFWQGSRQFNKRLNELGSPEAIELTTDIKDLTGIETLGNGVLVAENGELKVMSIEELSRQIEATKTGEPQVIQQFIPGPAITNNTTNVTNQTINQGTDSQTLSLVGNVLSISNGNSVVLPAGGAEADGVIGNEVTNVTGANSGLTRSGAGTTVDPYTLAANIGNGLLLASNQIAINSPSCGGGQALSWNGTAFACVSAGGTGDILQNGNSFGATMTIVTNDAQALNFETGGTTKASIAANGNLAVDTDTLFVDATNNKVAIGTTTAQEKLTIGTAEATVSSGSLQGIYANGGSGAGSVWRDTQYDVELWASANIFGGFLGTTSSNPLSLRTANANRLVLSATGDITIGAVDTTGNVLVLDTKTDAGDPTGVNGGMYYNSSSGKFRCFQASAWIDCIGAGGGSLFTDGGTATYLTSTTDELVVGSNSQALGAKLAIVGTSNQEQLLIRANSGQTNANPLVLFQNSTGTELARLNVDANSNIAFGTNALANNTSGSFNIALGSALAANTTGAENVAVGREALSNNTNGNYNVAVGRGALSSNNEWFNTAIGNNAGAGAVGAASGHNVFVGAESGFSITTANNNTLLGRSSGRAVTTGDNNLLLGYQTGDNLTTGSNNILLGYDLNATSATGSNQLNIGGVLEGDTSTLAAVFNGTLGYTAGTADTNTAVCRNAAGQLAACTSSARFKDDVLDLSFGLEQLRGLRPVSYNWKESGKQDVGFIAEEVAGIIPQAVTYDENGQVASFNTNTVVSLAVASLKELDSQVQKQQLQLDELQKAVWDGGVVTSDTTFNGLVTFNKEVRLSGRNVGSVKIPAGQTRTTVMISGSVDDIADVVATKQEFITGDWRITGKTRSGFVLELERPQAKDVWFDWHAF